MSSVCFNRSVQQLDEEQQRDGRRRAGAETRRRLIEATADALARSGPSGVSMRAITAEAGANVAAVKYHFGSRESLIAAVLADATRHVSRAQAERFDALETRADSVPLREWVAAWAAPIVAVVVSTSPEQRRLGRIVGNAVGEETGLVEEIRELARSSDERLVRGLSQVLAPIDERELWLRLTVMASALAGLAGGAFDPLLERAATEQPLDERLLDILETIARGRA